MFYKFWLNEVSISGDYSERQLALEKKVETGTGMEMGMGMGMGMGMETGMEMGIMMGTLILKFVIDAALINRRRIGLVLEMGIVAASVMVLLLHKYAIYATSRSSA